ncbi:SapC family protein [Nevskia sp.]|uniref:SapC family protein n=1 Tax=Nevskia sp. TaxID=1929292 RepID=UPI0025ED398D|nr:SapC family protein [Nevskia sp.]
MNDASAPAAAATATPPPRDAAAAAAAQGLPLFFRSIEALDSSVHRMLRRKPRESYQFATGTNAIPIVYGELPRIAQEYPVVFAGDGPNLHLVALVGLTNAENLFVGADGRWQGRYVPAYLRCYPFALARGPEQSPGTFTVAIDRACPEFSNVDGAPLFDTAGEKTAYLNQMLEFLQHYDAQMEQARRFATRIAELGLLVSVNAEARLRNGEQFAMSGLRVIERGALYKLSNEAKLELLDNEMLEMVYHHFASLQAFSQIVDRLAIQRGTSVSDVDPSIKA